MAISALAAGLLAGGASIASGLLNWKHDTDIMDYQYLLTSPQRRMQDMMKAGINPNVAAAGIAGTSPSVQGQNTPMPDFGHLVNDAYRVSTESKVADSTMRMNNANAKGQEIENDINESMISDRKAIISETRKKLVGDRRISEANASIFEAEATYAGTNAYHNAVIKQQQFKNMLKEWKKMDKEIQSIGKQMEVADSEIHRNEAQVELMAEQENTEKARQSEAYSSARRNNAEARKQEMKNEFWQEHGYDSDSPVDVSVRNAVENGKDEEAQRIIDENAEFQKSVSEAESEGRQEGLNKTEPTSMMRKRKVDEFNRELKSIDERIATLEDELDGYWKGEKKDNWLKTNTSNAENELKRLKELRKRKEEDMQRYMRRYNVAPTYGVGPVRKSD